MASVLVVEGDEKLRGAVVHLLRLGRYETMETGDGNEALELVESHDPNLVLIDLQTPGKTAIQLIDALRARGDARPVMVTSVESSLELAVQVTGRGAVDFLEKPVKAERLLVSIANALRLVQLHDENAQLKSNAGTSAELLGKSASMTHVRELIAKVASSEERVLLLGESGTGKDVAVAAIHAGSARRAGPLVKVNCGALPAEQIEGELFGHEKGVVNGTTNARRGKFELAQGGTLFLDEVSEIPAALQAKLLRVLSEGKFERVGGSRTLSADVRVVTATNRDLSELVQKKEFREDLYRRLNAVAVRLPALRERRGDIPVLAQSLLERALEKSGRRGISLGEDALEELSQLDYPGNVRELDNLVERLMIAADGPVITRDDVQRALPEKNGSGLRRAVSAPTPARFVPGVTYRELIARAEREVLLEAIAAFKGNKSAAARALGLERAHFAKKCRALGLRELEAAEAADAGYQSSAAGSRRS